MEDLFRPMSGDCTWLSVVADDRWRIGNGMGESFGSPAAAIRKLGFDVKEERVTAAERKVRERYPEAKSRGPIYTAGGVQFYEITSTRASGMGYHSLGKGASRARAWTDAASRLPTSEE